MIVCKNCGEQLLDDAVFCINCGQKVENVNAEVNVAEVPAYVAVENVGAEAQSNQAQEPQMMYNNQMQNQQMMQNNQMYNQQMQGYGYPVPPKKPLSSKAKKGIIAGIIAFFVVLSAIIVTIIVVSNINKDKEIKAKTVDLSEFIEVTYTGYDGYGTASYTIDSNALKEALIKAQEKNSKTTKAEKEYYAISLEYEISVSLSKDEKLSNGDKIEVNITGPSSQSLKAADIIADDVKYSIEVSGLKEVTKVNLFDYIEVTFDGVDGDITATIKNTATDDFLSGVYYDYPSKWYLSVGDKFTITIYDYEISNALENGYAFTETSKDYIVTGDSYFKKQSDISETIITQMNTTAEDIIIEYFDGISKVEASDIEIVGSYFLINEEKNDWYRYQNYYYPIYSVNIVSTDGKFEATTIYCTVEMHSILDKTSGEVTYMKGSSILGQTELKYSNFYYVKGFNSLEEAYNKCVVDNNDYLTLESKTGEVE